MTHKHEWIIDWEDGRAFCRWPCGKEMYFGEIERRLNATEELAIDTAEFGATFSREATNDHGMSQKIEGNIYFLTDALSSYAHALEEANDPQRG